MRYAYDIECFRNLFTATFVNVDDESDKRVFYVGLDREDWSDLKKFLTQDMTLIGYNNHSYDDPMLRFLTLYKGTKLTSELFDLSSRLVNDVFRGEKDLMELRYPKKAYFHWRSIDLMRILAFDKLGISLKQTAINLRWHKIQDMPVNFDASIHKSDLELVLSYNLNDVLITKKLYETITPIRELRDELSKLYHVDLTSASDSRMANLILEHIYSEELKMDMRAVRDMRTSRVKIFLGGCIAKFVKFQTPQLNELLDRISCTYVYDYHNFKYSDSVYFANCKFVLGIGGLHTEDEAGVFVSDKDYLIQDMDVASYYPNLIINNKFYPEHLGEGFIQVLKKITAERLSAKKAKDKVKADGLKITINSIFGKLGSPTFWLHDAKQMLSTTVSGQLGLLMLVEGLHLNGIPVISANTDGIVCKIPRDKLDKYYEIAKAWEKQTRMELEYTPYRKYVRRDVNSYITEKEDGSTKEKGAFLKEVDLKKAYHMPIVAKCLSAYFINGVPVRQTLEECKDIMEFCLSQKTGSEFILELHTAKGVETLQKTNRFYIAKKGGALIKKRMFGKSTIGLHVGKLVRILNDFDSSVPFNSYDVDLGFYEKEVMKIVDEIEPKQFTLFDMSSLGNTSITKAEIPTPLPVAEDNRIMIESLNKLGKNQLAVRLQTIISNNEKVEDISPRYAYVTRFDSRVKKAELYFLASGLAKTMPVKDGKLEAGQLVFCNKFEKTEKGHILSEYTITEKIIEDTPRLI